MTIRGSCLCSDVAFELNAAGDWMGHCHCSMCRKAHGAAYPPGAGEAVPFSRRSDAAPGVVRGSCLCGGIAYEIAGPAPGPIVNCHCARCRKARSAAHASNLFVEQSRFRWLRGEELLVSYK